MVTIGIRQRQLNSLDCLIIIHMTNGNNSLAFLHLAGLAIKVPGASHGAAAGTVAPAVEARTAKSARAAGFKIGLGGFRVGLGSGSGERDGGEEEGEGGGELHFGGF